MNLANFITGFTGHEHEHRAALLEVLGPEKHKSFFDKVRDLHQITPNLAELLSVQFLDYFFTSSDAKFFASLGLNCIRLPFNYRHFEDDMNPGVYKEEGFKLLDKVVDRCAQENLCCTRHAGGARKPESR